MSRVSLPLVSIFESWTAVAKWLMSSLSTLAQLCDDGSQIVGIVFVDWGEGVVVGW